VDRTVEDERECEEEEREQETLSWLKLQSQVLQKHGKVPRENCPAESINPQEKE
jgi:hypothetical protein